MEIAERFGQPKLDVAGFSWGGALAQQIAIQFPGRVERLVLMATTPSVARPVSAGRLCSTMTCWRAD